MNSSQPVDSDSLVRGDRDPSDKKLKMILIDDMQQFCRQEKKSQLACAYVRAFVISHFHVCSTADI